MAEADKERRLSDDILIAFHQACDQLDVETARHLLDVIELIALRPLGVHGGKERRAKRRACLTTLRRCPPLSRRPMRLTFSNVTARQIEIIVATDSGRVDV